MALSDWLEPYHDYLRPPPDVVMAEAAKQAELRNSNKLSKSTLNTTPPNGHAKKAEESPIVKDAPDVVVRFFDGKGLMCVKIANDG